MSDRPRKRSLTLRGHRTSVSLEPLFWEALQDLARARGRSVNALAADIDDARAAADPNVSLASALRSVLMQAALDGALPRRAARGGMSRSEDDAPLA